MINKLILTLIGALLATTAWAADLLTPVVLNQQVPDRYTVWELVLSEQGKPWFAYYGADNKLYVRRPGGDEIGLGATDRPREQSGLAMTQSGENGVALFWRDKQPNKTLFLIPKLDPKGDAPAPIVVGGEESAPLTALEIAHDDKGAYLLWLGEKGNPDRADEKYHLYFRTVAADGKTLSPVEQVLPGLYPAWIVDEKVIPIFSWIEGEKPTMSMRVFDR